MTDEPPSLPPLTHAGAHILNAPVFERQFARVYLGNRGSREAIELRKRLADGARRAMEEQYWSLLEHTIQTHPAQASLGGDPSIANRARAFLGVYYYKNGQWEQRLEVRAS